MKQQEAFVPSFMVRCNKCDRGLWIVKILSYRDNKPQSTEWTSMNPSLYRGEPENTTCPLCKKEFAVPDKHGNMKLSMVDMSTGKRIYY